MELKTRIKSTLAKALMQGRPELRILYMLARPKQDRSTRNVTAEYTTSWNAFARHLERSRTLDEWLFVEAMDGLPRYYNIDGAMRHQSFNSNAFYLETLSQAIGEHFPKARTITEYGSGLGRNLLFLKRRFPDLTCHGYELCAPGVEIARAAAKKFDLDVSYSRLDIVKGRPEEFVSPPSDIAFTMFALEQLPEANAVALRNILDRVSLGSIHLEPVVEKYPISYRGLLGRVYHHKIDYLRNFDANARAAGLREVLQRTLFTSHNAVVFPSLYVLKK
ncbi:MAG: class I SAM-dependent methyltransferase [Myxococcales bacterium]|nr:class I SAM-dependent methyltransferase [Myxococcales bacterium]